MCLCVCISCCVETCKCENSSCWDSLEVFVFIVMGIVLLWHMRWGSKNKHMRFGRFLENNPDHLGLRLGFSSRWFHIRSAFGTYFWWMSFVASTIGLSTFGELSAWFIANNRFDDNDRCHCRYHDDKMSGNKNKALLVSLSSCRDWLLTLWSFFQQSIK